MKSSLVIVIVVFSLYQCNGVRTKRDDPKHAVDTLRFPQECLAFDFQDSFRDQIWTWYKKTGLVQVDSAPLLENLVNSREFSDNPTYQSIYWYCPVNLPGGVVGQTFIQRMHNDAESSIVLFYRNKGQPYFSHSFLLAKIQKSPDDFLLIKSRFLAEDRLERISVYINSDGIVGYKDSVVSEFTFRNNAFSILKKDSIRVDLK